ncbi:MAG: hypothetical protein HZB18_01920 [Chloroflexi bacterium]|nr:hypothetical protein [Chloroflexota bacterium]
MAYSKPRIAKITAILLLLGILIQILYDPISSARHSLEISSVRNQLPQARTKWEGFGISDYTFEIIGDARSICQPSARIEVQNDAVAKVEMMDFTSEGTTPQLLSPDRWADPDWGNEIFLCNYNQFTMTSIFELIEQTLQNFPSSIIQTDFDPEYGFVTYFRYGIYTGHGWLRPQVSDCCNVFRIQNFQPNSRQSRYPHVNISYPEHKAHGDFQRDFPQ